MGAFIAKLVIQHIFKVVIVAGIVSAAGFIWWKGYDAARDKYVAMIKAEQARIERIVSEEKARHEERVQILNGEIAKLEKELENVHTEADADPNAGRPAIGPRGVQRLNRIGG